MSPILVRPVREQLEHDRIIRLLQAKYKRKFEVAINPGNEQTAPVGGPPPWYPDLVLQDARGKKLLGVVEVETAESVNHLEAMSQWAAFSRLRTPFHLYVPVSMIDVARRLAQDMQIPVAEVWAYSSLGDQLRFTLVQRSAPTPESKPRPAPAAPRPVAAAPRPVAAAPRGGSNGAGSPAKAKKPVAAAPKKAAPLKKATAPKKAVAAKKPAAAAAKKKGAAKKIARPVVKKAAPSARSQKRK